MLVVLGAAIACLVARVVTACWPARASIPVVGVAEVSFDAVQPGMDPRAFGVVLRLREFVRGIPIATQAVPDGAQHRRRAGRRRLALKAEDELVYGVGHRAILPKRYRLGCGATLVTVRD